MFIRLDFQPGVDVERSPTTMRGGWVDSNLVRVREGKYEKHLGWQRISDRVLQGRARSMHYWADLNGIPWLAVGTNEQLYIVQLQAYDVEPITPQGFSAGEVDQFPGLSSTPLIWSLDNFGQNLIAFPSGLGMYVWLPGDPPQPAILEPAAPMFNIGGYVAMPQQIVFAYGCTPYGGLQPDPMLIRWSDQQNYQDWTPSTINQAGSYRIPRGSRIIGGLSSILGNFFWTDLDFWSAQYSGFPLVFGFQNIGPNSGLLSRGAVASTGQAIFWASDHGFFLFSGGGAQPIPCTVWDQFYANIVHSQQEKVVAGADQHHNEVYFFFPSLAGNSGEIDSYLKYNFVENVWDFGSATPDMPNALSRTCWTDQNRPGGPLSVDLNNLIQQSDIGVDADGVPMRGVSLTSGYLDVDEGEGQMFIDMLIPDFLWDQSTVSDPSLEMSLLFRQWPGDQPTVKGPFTITPKTRYVGCRARAREIAFKITCDSPGTWFRMGTPRVRSSRDGKL